VIAASVLARSSPRVGLEKGEPYRWPELEASRRSSWRVDAASIISNDTLAIQSTPNRTI